MPCPSKGILVAGLAVAAAVACHGAAAAGDAPWRARLAIFESERQALRAVGDAGFVCLGRVCVVPHDEVPRVKGYGTAIVRKPTLLRPRLDLAASECGFEQAWSVNGVSGEGVLVGVVDTGIDWRHPDFIDGEGRTRIAWLLDQNLPPTGEWPELERIGGGAVYSGEQVQQALDGAARLDGAGADRIGHGTHVAGIAASDDELYRGPAWRAKLAVVKAYDESAGGFTEDRLVRALVFLDRVARKEGMPLVVNLSLGNQMGAHDGTTPLELAIESLARRAGRAVVVAAGNEGEKAAHARIALDEATEESIGLFVPASGTPESRVTVDIWAVPRGTLRVSLRGPAGDESQWIGPGASGGQSVDFGDASAELECGNGEDPLNGLWHCTVEITGAGYASAAGLWELLLRGSSPRLDAWIGEFELGGGWPEFTDHVDPGNMVGPPATARGAIAVGAYAHRREWKDITGAVHDIYLPHGERCPFSVLGPTLDGRLKPDLAAPGWMVASTLSSQTDPRDPSSLFFLGGRLDLVVQDGRHALSGGTSAAAPLVTGVAALVLGREPFLTGIEVQRRLVLASRTDEATGSGLFSPAWGFGKLDSATLFERRPASVPSAELSLCGLSRRWLSEFPEGAVATAMPRDAAGIPLGPGLDVSIDAAGVKWAGPVVDEGWGLYTRRIESPPRRGASAFVVCAASGVTFHASAELRSAASHEEAFGGGLRGPGCAAVPGEKFPLAIAALVAAVALLRLRRSREAGR